MLIGYGYHGDFIEAWEPGVLQDAVDQCTNLSGNMEDCPVFSYNSEPGSCALENPLPAEIASEDVKGPMHGLPNRVQVQSGPEPANPPTGSNSGGGGGGGKEVEPPKKTLAYSSEPAPTSIVKIPTVPVSDPSEPSSTRGAAVATAEPGRENRYIQQKYSESPKASSKPVEGYPSSTAPAPVPTNKPDVDKAPVALQGGKAISTTYWTSGRQAHEVILILEEVTITADGGTVTKTDEASGAQETHYKRQHKHHHHAGRGIGGRKMML